MSDFDRLRTSLDQKEKSNAEKRAPGAIVRGANLLRHFNVRCPECNKLFRVNSREIASSSPHFECSACTTKFTFSYPPTDLRKIETKVVNLAKEFALSEIDLDALPEELKSCPKCQAVNPRNRTECIRCHAIFARVELVKSQPELGAWPGLAKTWTELLGDYNHITKHLAFVDRCEELEALPYALKKYQSLREAQPQDPFVHQMINKVLIRGVKKDSSKVTELIDRIQNLNAKINWHIIGKVSPLVLSSLLILIGSASASKRNLIGVGVSILFLTVGLTIFVKGRIKLSDLWD